MGNNSVNGKLILVLGGAFFGLVVAYFLRYSTQLSGGPSNSKSGLASPTTDSASSGSAKESLKYQEWKKKVEFYRQQTGIRLNQQRLKVEQDNFKALPLGPSVAPQGQPDRVLNHLPLQGERIHSADQRPRPSSIVHPDQKIEDLLHEKQQINEYNRQMEKAYVDEFVRNAAKEGYKVKVHSDGTVEVLKAPSQNPDLLDGRQGP